MDESPPPPHPPAQTHTHHGFLDDSPGVLGTQEAILNLDLLVLILLVVLCMQPKGTGDEASG